MITERKIFVRITEVCTIIFFRKLKVNSMLENQEFQVRSTKLFEFV